jgi:hypothetical protein
LISNLARTVDDGAAAIVIIEVSRISDMMKSNLLFFTMHLLISSNKDISVKVVIGVIFLIYASFSLP